MSGGSGHRILVTGAGGFVGGWLLRALRGLLGESDRIVPTVRDASELGPEHGAMVLDLADRDAIDRTVAEAQPTALIHLAAISAVGAVARDPDAAWDINVKATHHLASALLRHCPRARFVQIGSGEVYGGSVAAGASLTDENAPLRPHTLYAVTKAAADLLIGQMQGQGLDAVRFRTFNHTGPGQGTDFAVPAFAAQVARIEAGLQEPVIAVGDLAAMRDFCDVRDVVRAYARAALCEPAPAPVINIAGGRSCSVRSVLDRLLALSGARIEIRVDPARLRAPEPPRPDVDVSLASRALGWRPEIPLEDTLRAVLDHWRQVVAAERIVAG
jgi:GDP-4-dehydro-6-deoxy-D-mannose reductase